MLDLMKLNSFCLRNGIATDFFLLYFLYPTFFVKYMYSCIHFIKENQDKNLLSNVSNFPDA